MLQNNHQVSDEAWTMAKPECPTLPGKMQRSDVEQLLTIVSPTIGLSGARLRALLVMIQQTRPSDWTSGLRNPVCYQRQMVLAARIGVSPRTMRAHENALERAGLLIRDIAADGSRGAFAQGGIVQGLNFRPLINAIPTLLIIRDRIEAGTLAIQILRRKISAGRRVFNRALSELLERCPRHPNLAELLQEKAQLPRRYDDICETQLGEVLATVDNLARKTLDLIEMHQKTSGVPEENIRPHIQDTNQEYLESCSASDAIKRTACKQAETKSYTAEPHGPAGCLENKHESFSRGHKPEFLETFSPRQLYWMASDDMRMYLDAQHSGPATALKDHDFIQAAISILPALGVSPTAWDDAAETMGNMAAALCVVVIDANRYHPQKPIHSPGGALRAFTRLAAAGKLNLHGSLIGLNQRSRPLCG